MKKNKAIRKHLTATFLFSFINNTIHPQNIKNMAMNAPYSCINLSNFITQIYK